MIGTAIAILTAIGPLVPVIKSAIQGTEDAIGPGQGENKKKIVIDSVSPVATALKKAGVIPADVNVDTIADGVELIFNLLKKTGDLRERKTEETVEAPGNDMTAYPAKFNISGSGTIQFTKRHP